MNAGSGSAGFGNIPCGMKRICSVTLIISISTRQDISWCREFPIGRTPHFMNMYGAGFTLPIGAAATTSWIGSLENDLSMMRLSDGLRFAPPILRATKVQFLEILANI